MHRMEYVSVEKNAVGDPALQCSVCQKEGHGHCMMAEVKQTSVLMCANDAHVMCSIRYIR